MPHAPTPGLLRLPHASLLWLLKAASSSSVLSCRVGFVLSYNMLADVAAGDKFATITRTGASGLLHLVASWRARHR